METYIQVVTTADSQEGAERLAQELLSKRLAACVQMIGPIGSHYWWRNEIESAQEWLCLIKTRAERFAEVDVAIRAIHPYDVPEITAVPIVAGSAEYLAWLGQEVPATPRP